MTSTEKIKFNIREFVSIVGRKFSDSIGDMIVTVAITGITLTYMFQIVPDVYANTIPGMYLFAMIVQLFIRIVHRFDDSYTNDEIAERVIELEENVNQRLDALMRS